MPKKTKKKGKKGISRDTKVQVKAKPKAKPKAKRLTKKQKQLKAKRSLAAKKGHLTRKYRQVMSTAVVRPAEYLKIQETSFLLAKQKLINQGIAEELIDTAFDESREVVYAGLDLVDADEPTIMAELVKADLDGNFDERAYELAEEYDWDEHDIYSLWYSYEPD